MSPSLSDEADPGQPQIPSEVLGACALAIRRIRARKPNARTFGVTSSVPGEGRSTIAAGLALAAARGGDRRAVLVDLDTDQWLPGSPGPGADSESAFSATEAIDWTNQDLGVLRLGNRFAASTVTRAQVGTVLADLLNHELDVVAGLSCLPPSGTGDRFAGLFDEVVMVVRAGRTGQDVVRRAADALGEPPVILLNRTASAVPRFLRGR